MSVLTERKNRARRHVPLQILLALWCVFVANAWVFHSSIRSDWTADGLLTVTDSDRELIKALTGPVEVVIPLNLGPEIEDTLKTRVLLKSARWLEELSQVAPNRLQRPILIRVNQEGEKWAAERARRVPALEETDVDRIHFFHDGRRVSLSAEELADFRIPSALEPEGVAEILVDRTREGVESALRRLIREDQTLIRISQGSGEPGLKEAGNNSMAALRKDLESRGAQVEGIRLPFVESIPGDTDLLVVVAGGVGSWEPLGASVERSIQRYLDAGGGVVLLLPGKNISGLEGLLSRSGIDVGPGLVAEEIALEQGLVRPAFVAVGRQVHPRHPVTVPFLKRGLNARFSPARVLQLSEEATPLLTTGPGAWVERDGRMAQRDPGESPSPQVIAAASEVGGGRLIVVSSWTPVLNALWQGDSRRFLLSCFHWAAGETQPLGAGREPITRRVELSAPFRNSFFWTALAVLPACAFFGGLLVSALRRRNA